MRKFAKRNRSRGSGKPSGSRAGKTSPRQAANIGLQNAEHHFDQIKIYASPTAGLQAKKWVSSPGDEAEKEADEVANKVMRMPDEHAPEIGAKDEEENVQRKETGAGNFQTSPSFNNYAASLNSAGKPLDGATRSFFEPRFGHSFGHVRVHTNSNASQSAKSVNAKAYTLGHNIVFNDGEYNPATKAGQQLLAHELTHTIQQKKNNSPGRGTIQRKANSIRFSEDAVLDDISDGKRVLKEGDKEPAVIKITQAISELGFYPISLVDESFDPPLTSSVEKYQVSKGIAKTAIAGQVDQPTFKALDNEFLGTHKVERDVLSKQKAGGLFAGTDLLDTMEKKEAEKAISTEPKVNPITGLPPKFTPKIPGVGDYADLLLKTVENEIKAEYNSMGKGKAADHADPNKIYSISQVDAIATEAQKAVDSIFGEYKKGPAMKGGVTILDAWTDKEDQLKKGGKPKEDSSAIWRVNKILTGDDNVKALDNEFGAIQSRAAEKAIVDSVRTAMVSKYRTELIETHKGWPGYEDNGKVFIQLFKGADDDKNRFNMWDYFQTFIHEYIHSLESSAHITYRRGKAEQKGGFVLREGVTDYFTKIVWESIPITDALRKTIEGPYNDPKVKFKIQPLNTYGESKNAERLAGVVGIRNLAAAFFLGSVDLIGQ